MTVDERTLELQKKAEALLENDEVLGKMLYAENPEALMQVFAENNIIIQDVTPEEVFAAFQRVRTGELTEDDLDNVSGGVYLMLKTSIFTFAISGSVGAALCVAGGVAAIGLAAYAGYRIIKKHT